MLISYFKGFRCKPFQFCKLRHGNRFAAFIAICITYPQREGTVGGGRVRGGCHRTSTTLKSGNKMKKKKIPIFPPVALLRSYCNGPTYVITCRVVCRLVFCHALSDVVYTYCIVPRPSALSCSNIFFALLVVSLPPLPRYHNVSIVSELRMVSLVQYWLLSR